MPIDPKFIRVVDVNIYPELKCIVHSAIPARAALDIGINAQREVVIGLCPYCVEALGQALEPFKPQSDYVERQHEQEYGNG